MKFHYLLPPSLWATPVSLARDNLYLFSSTNLFDVELLEEWFYRSYPLALFFPESTCAPRQHCCEKSFKYNLCSTKTPARPPHLALLLESSSQLTLMSCLCQGSCWFFLHLYFLRAYSSPSPLTIPCPSHRPELQPPQWVYQLYLQ